MIKKILQDQFLKHNFIYFTGSMILGVINYAYHPVMSRLMTVEDFGETQAIISLSLLSGLFLGFYPSLVTNHVANNQDGEELNDFLAGVFTLVLPISIGIFLLVILFSGALQRFFYFSSPYPLFSLGVLYLFSVNASFRSSYLHGRKRFSTVSLASITQAGSRLFFAVVLVLLGWRVFGAITALVLAQICGLAYLYLRTRKSIKIKTVSVKHLPIVWGKLKPYLPYAGLLLIATMTITFFYSADVLFVKRFFPPAEAGLYSGIASIARVIFFLTAPIGGVLFPSIIMKNGHHENARLLIKSLLVVAVLGGAFWLIIWQASAFVIKTFIGVRYLDQALLLPLLGLLLLSVSLANILVMYYLALRQYFILYACLAGAVLTIILMLIRHQTLEQVIYNFLFGSLILVSGLLSRFAYHNLRRLAAKYV